MVPSERIEDATSRYKALSEVAKDMNMNAMLSL
jgi:hypothetical protein